ncbi:MAG: hypothetical protein LW623_10535 [Sphingomonadaceae bacterium]|jgi:hypothetical protein|uniref:hypothetical protein n=1 Tax=Sphingorhabdus sp. TaxID=1902408 RepID=UPI0039BD8CDB|nr:hypothetical protein [Sphingomonadaceae bacterium]
MENANIKAAYENLVSVLAHESGGDLVNLHSMRRSVMHKLINAERGTVSKRNALRRRLSREQDNKCHVCGCDFKPKGKYAVLDRRIAHLGYVHGNVDLKCNECDRKKQEDKKFS